MLDFQLTRTNQGSNDALDSDANEVGGVYEIGMTSPRFGGRDDTNDFGFVKRIVLGLIVWRDQNNDGQRNELGRINGVLVSVLDPSGMVICTATTDVAGQYAINSGNCPLITPGRTYTVSLPLLANFQPAPANSGNDLTDSDGTYDATTNTLRASVFVPSYGYINRTIDFGLVPVFSIGDFVWSDDNGDGQQDNLELGINNVNVELWAADQVTGLRAGSAPIATSTTTTRGTTQGFYQFTSFSAAMTVSTKYVLQATIPNNYQPSPVNSTTDDSVDSDSFVPTSPNGVVQVRKKNCLNDIFFFCCCLLKKIK